MQYAKPEIMRLAFAAQSVRTSTVSKPVFVCLDNLQNSIPPAPTTSPAYEIDE